MTVATDALKLLRPEIEATGLPWRVENGGSHRKLYIAGHFICVLPLSHRKDGQSSRRAYLNTRAQIRRAARGAT